MKRALFTLMGFSFFCLLSLSTPDADLIATDAEIQIPFADVPIDFSNFLIVGPGTLVGILIYLHIFLGHLRVTDPPPMEEQAPTLFNLPHKSARFISALLFYWLGPLVLWAFARKAIFHPSAPFLIALTIGTLYWMVLLQIRRSPRHSTARLAVLVLISVMISVVTVDKAILFMDGRPMSQSALGDHVEMLQPVLAGIFRRKLELQHVSLRNRDLRGFDLTSANFRNADLRGSDLRGAAVDGADFTGANLQGAQFGTGRQKGQQ